MRWRGLTRLEAGASVPEEAFTLLRRVPMFAPLLLGMVENLAHRLHGIDLPERAAVIREGEPGDCFYLIAHGDFDVTSGAGRFPPLGAGDVFGEIALLRDVPRTATVTARSEARVYALERELFLTAVSGHRFSTRAAGTMADERAETYARGSGRGVGSGKGFAGPPAGTPPARPARARPSARRSCPASR